MNALCADNWQALLICLVSERLDGETRREWELQTTAKTLKTYDDFKTFIEQRAFGLEAAPMAPLSVVTKKSSKSLVLVATQFPSCSKCNETHRHHQCGHFKKFSIADRTTFTKSNSKCFFVLAVATMRGLTRVNKFVMS